MIEFIKNIFTVNSAINAIKFILPIMATYFITKYSVNRPRKLEISQLQFENVYLPLYKIICTKNTKNASKEDITRYLFRIKEITQRHYELTFPQLHKLIDTLFLQLKNDNGYQETFNKISYQVSLDYEILKKTLGYPSETSLNIFIRKTKKEKLKIIMSWVFLLYIFILFFIPSFLLNNGMLTFLILYLLGFVLLILISNKINKMKD